jgi:hypothetical protein
MKTKIFTPIIALLLVVFMGSCQKDQRNDSTSASSANKLSATALSSNTNLNALVLPGINLGVAGNFAILSKTGITSV